MKKVIVVLTVAFSLFTLSAFSSDKLNSEFRTISNAEKQKIINWSLAKVQNESELEIELNYDNSPLYLLSDYGRSEFLSSIVFRENGLGGFNMGPLEDELTPSQIYQVLSLFGAQHTTHKFKKARIDSSLDLLLLAQPIQPELLQPTDPIPLGLPGSGGKDYDGYECLRRATCSSKARHICMSGC